MQELWGGRRFQRKVLEATESTVGLERVMSESKDKVDY